MRLLYCCVSVREGRLSLVNKANGGERNIGKKKKKKKNPFYDAYRDV